MGECWCCHGSGVVSKVVAPLNAATERIERACPICASIADLEAEIRAEGNDPDEVAARTKQIMIDTVCSLQSNTEE